MTAAGYVAFCLLNSPHRHALPRQVHPCSRVSQHNWKLCHFNHCGEVAARRRHPGLHQPDLCPYISAVSTPHCTACVQKHSHTNTSAVSAAAAAADDDDDDAEHTMAHFLFEFDPDLFHPLNCHHHAVQSKDCPLGDSCPFAHVRQAASAPGACCCCCCTA